MKRSIVMALVLAAGCSDDAGAGTRDAGGPGGDGTWRPLADVGGGAIQEIGVATLGDDVYVLGGFDDGTQIVSDVRVYDPDTDAWTVARGLPEAVHHANVAVASGKLYVVGAMRLQGFNFVAIGDVWEYDPGLDEWTARRAMPAGTERGASAVGVIDGAIYVAGGLRGGSVADFSRYDPAQDEWEPLPDLPAPRDHLVGGAVGGSFYAIGGRSGGIAGLTGRVDVYEPGVGSWRSGAAMITPRGGAAAGVVDGEIIVVGGEGNASAGSGVFPQVESYDPDLDTWTSLQPMITPRHGMGAAGVGDTLYVPGGATVQGFGAVATFEALTLSSP
jgi:N-acetylneuraminic acid mutarotase